jgi:dimethylargininase
MLIAVTRAVSPALAECELTHLPRDPIDVAKAIADHERYEAALRALGARVVRAPEEPTLPDAVFVEDTALVLDELAVLTRPGAASRRSEVESMARVLGAYKPLARIQPPGTLDGGDVLVLGRKIYVGRSSRSNHEGIEQLQTLVSGFGYDVIPVAVKGCLHLKSAVTEVADNLLLVNERWVRPEYFAPIETMTVAPSEPAGANALRIASAVIYPEHYPDTADLLDRAGVRVVPVPCAELAKAEGGVTCCSVLFATERSS